MVTAYILKRWRGVGHGAGLEKVQAAAGNIARFQLIFKLTSDVNDNYLHIHTMKGILVASRVSFSPCKLSATCKAGTCHSSNQLVPHKKRTRMLHEVIWTHIFVLCKLPPQRT